MKKILLAFGIVLVSFLSYGQKTTHPKSFRLEGNYSSESFEKHKSLIIKANLEGFRLKNEDVTLEFENGVKCILFSAESIKSRGVNINPSDYKEDFSERFTLPMFKVSNSGHLMTVYKKKLK